MAASFVLIRDRVCIITYVILVLVRRPAIDCSPFASLVTYLNFDLGNFMLLIDEVIILIANRVRQLFFAILHGLTQFVK
jgi:hypothetical protein